MDHGLLLTLRVVRKKGLPDADVVDFANLFFLLFDEILLKDRQLRPPGFEIEVF